MWWSLQEAHYVSTASRRSSLRWTSVIIHHLLLTAWDLWQFQNNRQHGETGPFARAKHALLDSQMSKDLIIGSAGMLPDTACLLSISLAELKAYTLVEKRLWLDSMQLGRKHYARVQAPTPEFEQECNFMSAWLHRRLSSLSNSQCSFDGLHMRDSLPGISSFSSQARGTSPSSGPINWQVFLPQRPAPPPFTLCGLPHD